MVIVSYHRKVSDAMLNDSNAVPITPLSKPGPYLLVGAVLITLTVPMRVVDSKDARVLYHMKDNTRFEPVSIHHLGCMSYVIGKMIDIKTGDTEVEALIEISDLP
jgi:hypothetical protein